MYQYYLLKRIYGVVPNDDIICGLNQALHRRTVVNCTRHTDAFRYFSKNVHVKYGSITIW
jgi:hypothetical protein